MNYDIKTYSFADVTFVLRHPSVGQFTFTGKGTGSVSFNNSNDATVHDVAADGAVMISKILVENGLVAINLQQVSEGHLWLLKLLKYLKEAPTSEWARASAILNVPATGEIVNFIGVSPQKRADATFQAQGQQVTWNMMAARISG